MIDQRQERINEAAQQFAEALVESYGTRIDFFSAQKVNAQLTQNFFDAVIDYLRKQSKDKQLAPQELMDQQMPQVGLTQALSPEAANAYRDFLSSLLFYWSSTQVAKETRGNQGTAEG